jgi:hypothetical protein
MQDQQILCVWMNIVGRCASRGIFFPARAQKRCVQIIDIGSRSNCRCRTTRPSMLDRAIGHLLPLCMPFASFEASASNLISWSSWSPDLYSGITVFKYLHNSCLLSTPKTICPILITCYGDTSSLERESGPAAPGLSRTNT